MIDYSLLAAAPYAERIRDELRKNGHRCTGVLVLHTPGIDDEEVRLFVVVDALSDAEARDIVATVAGRVRASSLTFQDAPNGTLGVASSSALVASLWTFPWNVVASDMRTVAGMWRGFGFGRADVIYLEAEDGTVLRDFPKVGASV